MNTKTVAVGFGCLAAIVLAVLLLVSVLAGSYNGLTNKQQAVEAQWAQVENVYQRRADLVPNLVNTVAGAANFEKSTLVEVTNARARVGQVSIPSGAPTSQAQIDSFAQAQNGLGGALSRLLVVAEKYPTLTATRNFQDLQAQLEGTENRIAVERQKFNEAAQGYNTAIKIFPAVFYAGFFGFKEKPYFQAVAGSDVAPKVNFDFNGGNKAP